MIICQIKIQDLDSNCPVVLTIEDILYIEHKGPYNDKSFLENGWYVFLREGGLIHIAEKQVEPLSELWNAVMYMKRNLP